MTEAELTRLTAPHCDEAYRAFHRRLTRTQYPVSGVRVPVLRAIAKDLARAGKAEEVAVIVPTRYESAMLKGLTIAYAELPEERKLDLLEAFTADIDDWAVCDMVAGTYKKTSETYFCRAQAWARSDDLWRCRYGLVTLLSVFSRQAEYAERIVAVLFAPKAAGYYVDMAQAWLIQAISARDKDRLALLSDARLSAEVRRMAARKCLDSYSFDAETKSRIRQTLKTLLSREN